MESAIEHDKCEFTNPATKHTLSVLIDPYLEGVLPSKLRNEKNTLSHLKRRRNGDYVGLSCDLALFFVII